MRKTTIRDIARLAEVSPAAVSFVINGKKGVSETTRAKIQRIIDETGFVPDNNSRRFFFKKNFTVALVQSPTVSLFDDIFYYEVARGLDHESDILNYSVIFTGLRQDAGNLALPEVIRSKDTDGLVFLQEVPVQVRDEIRDIGLPCVVADASYPDGSFTTVHTDYRLAAYTATRYLIDHGHTAIAFLGANRVPAFYMSTYLGYKKAMDEINAPVPPYWMQPEANDDASTRRCVNILLDKEPLPTALFCATDMIAITAMNHAREKGFGIPRDISFMGIDDVMTSAYVYPPLTTVRINKFEMGKAAMDLLINKINGVKIASRLIEPEGIVERKSVFTRDHAR